MTVGEFNLELLIFEDVAFKDVGFSERIMNSIEFRTAMVCFVLGNIDPSWFFFPEIVDPSISSDTVLTFKGD